MTDKDRIALPPATKELVQRLADLEGITSTQMMIQMARFYDMAINFLHKEGMTPQAFNEFVLTCRKAVIEKGMEVFGQALRGEDYAAQQPPKQTLGTQKFTMPSEHTIVRGEDEYTPVPPAPPTPAQREVK